MNAQVSVPLIYGAKIGSADISLIGGVGYGYRCVYINAV